MNAFRTTRDRAQARTGTVLKDKWQLDALLGVGGTAAVYAATHRNGKRAAIKILHPQLSLDEHLVARFLREGYAANKLDHPGAVSVLDDDRTDDGSVYLVMELLDGVSLERFTRANGDRMPLHQVLRVADELLDVLAAAHAHGVVHRDIKPANLFLTRDGRLKVLDFGIARLTEGLGDEHGATQTGAAIGTPAFMPPEQARGRSGEIDARTDVWAVGATLFALTSGRRPRRAETVNEELLMAMTQAVPPLASVAPSLPPELCAVVDRACAFDREQRWRDAREMQLALRQVAARLQPSYDVPIPASAPGHDGPQPDTAPVLHGAAEMQEPQLTTSRPLVQTGASLSSPRAVGGRASKNRVMLVAFLTTFGFGAAALVFFVHLQRAQPAAATQTGAASPAPRATSPAPPQATAPADETAKPPATATADTIPTTPSAHAVAPRAAGPRHTHPEPHAQPEPRPSAASGNLFDQRF